MIKPDYSGSGIVNLMASIQAGLKAPIVDYPCLDLLPAEQIAAYPNVVLLVIDGLGWDYVQNHPQSVLAQHARGRLTTVFPATTAAAITTFMTGVAPQQHAHTGWFAYYHEIDRVLAGLPFTRRGCGSKETDVAINNIFSTPTVFDRLPLNSFVISPESIAFSDFNVLHSGHAKILPHKSFEEIFFFIEAICKQPQKNYIYAYWSEFDTLTHAYGVASKEVSQHFKMLDAALEKFLTSKKAQDTLFILTADHGFVDIESECTVYLNAYSEAYAMLSQPLCGEPRAAYCYVRGESVDTFANFVQKNLAEVVELRSSQSLIDENYFGLGEMHPQLRNRIGDFTLLAKDGFAIKDKIDGEVSYTQIGMHGGMSAAEMYVPLVVAT